MQTPDDTDQLDPPPKPAPAAVPSAARPMSRDELDAAIQMRADFVREALRVEASGRAMLRSIAMFLNPDAGQPTAPGESWRGTDGTEADELTEVARNAARRAAYSRACRIFENDLPYEGDPTDVDYAALLDPREAHLRAQLAAFGCPVEGMMDDEGEGEGDPAAPTEGK